MFHRIFLLLTVFVAGNVMAAVEVETESIDADALSSYKTYAWREPGEIGNTPSQPYRQEYFSTLRTELARALAKKGYREVSQADADFLVSFTGFITDEFRDSPENRAIDVGNARITLSRSEAVSGSSERGNLRVFIIDVESDKPVWQASAATAAKNKKSNLRAIKEAARKMMRGFPEASR
ncbi:MAG: DUF4136 domain-containing protein [Gammaproteobacteria bacterium]|nr:DUF4136 domain-containing protein [Gammaproteobacteria bacterium]